LSTVPQPETVLTPAQTLDAIHDLAHRLYGDVKLAPIVDGDIRFQTSGDSLEDAPVVEADIQDIADLQRLCVFTDGFDRFTRNDADRDVEFVSYLNAETGGVSHVQIAGEPDSNERCVAALKRGLDGSGMWRAPPVNKEFQAKLLAAIGLTDARPANDNQPQARVDTKKRTEAGAPYPGIVSSADFVRNFVPPDYHIDGVAQAGFLYSTTAMTGTGKTAVLLLISALTMMGAPLGDREVRKGRVIYFAGENPDDVRMRWIAMSHAIGFDPNTVDVYFIAGAFSVAEMFERIRADVEKIGGAEMIVVDTSAAYFQGDDENSNTQLGRHARELRTLTTLPGKPVVFAACHPVKNADPSNLLPRGGGAFIAEVDGNLTLNKADATVRMHWQGKHRGPDFSPIHFELETVTAPSLIDSRGRNIPTVMAKVLSAGEAKQRARNADADGDTVLLEIERAPHQSLSEIADSIGWKTASDEPDKERARRACDRLTKDKLVVSNAGGRGRKLTKAGLDALVDVRAQRFKAESDARVAANVIATVQHGRVEHESEQHDNTAA
jgi:hypothetical protein